MEREKYERLLNMVTSADKDENAELLSRETSRDELRMWGKIAADTVGKSAGDWLVGSWSTDGLPRWVPRMHYYRREDRKFYVVRPNIAAAKMELIVDQEDRDLDPERAKFIMDSVDTWERELEPVVS
jgi:hypothetical protein